MTTENTPRTYHSTFLRSESIPLHGDYEVYRKSEFDGCLAELSKENERLKEGLRKLCECPDSFFDPTEEMCEFCQLRFNMKTIGEYAESELS